MGIAKSEKLRTTFLKYVITLGLLIVTLVIVTYFLDQVILFSLGIYPANYSEKVIENNIEELRSSRRITMEFLTPMCSFGVYSIDGEYLYGNFSEEDINRVWDSFQTGNKSVDLSNYIYMIERDEGIALVKYPLTAQYKNEFLRRWLPNPEITMIVLFLIKMVAVILFWSSRFARKINKELKALLLATEKINKQDLDFNVGKSKIVEIDHVLQGIDKMKRTLKDSLEEQWSVEQRKQEQISALAHDIKTPLTILKGNIELIQETELSEEQREYCNYIYDSCMQMDNYVKELLGVFRSEAIIEEFSDFLVMSFLDNLKNQAKALCCAKDIALNWKADISKEAYVLGNEENLMRAMMNIISNAVEFSPEQESLIINSSIKDSNLFIRVEDRGKGFTEKMLKYGKQQLAMGDESRTQSGHHGLGLYIADTIIKKHNGELILENSKNGGGIVTVIIPLIE